MSFFCTDILDTQYTPQHAVVPPQHVERSCSSLFILDQQNFDIGSVSAASPHFSTFNQVALHRSMHKLAHSNYTLMTA